MKISDKITLKAAYTGGEVIEYPLNSGRAVCEGFEFIIKEENGVISPEIKVTAEETAGLSYVIIQYEMAGDFADGDMVYYTDDHSTNARTLISTLAECRDSYTNSVMVMRNNRTGDCLGFGRVTGWRFFAYLGISGRNIYIQHQMEDKPLYADREYKLEKYILGDEKTEEFLERYAKTAAKLNNACPAAEIPVGFCSWSRYYHGVDEAKIINASEGVGAYCGELGNLVQIDDGWQIDASFPGVWETNLEKFPNGMAYTAGEVHKRGQKFGLWLAPLLITKTSRYLGEVKDFVRTDTCTMPDVYPFDLDKEETYAHIAKTFRKMVDEYHADYFKLDFLFAGYRYFTEGQAHPEVRFKSDYCVALFRRAMQTIRDTVGDGVMLLSCGAPLVECYGIFNYQRASCDVIWGKNDGFPPFWQILREASATVIHRYFYNNVLFMNDPDGIVMRDIDIGDGFDCSYSEAKYWVASAFVSGGSWLHNEELENLSRGRRELFTRCLPYIGATGKPVDFFAVHPDTVISEKDGLKFVTFFNTSGEYADFDFDLALLGIGKAKITKMLDGEELGVHERIKEHKINAHCAEIYIVEEVK